MQGVPALSHLRADNAVTVWGRRLARAAGAASILLTAIWGAAIAGVVYVGRQDWRRPADAIVVLGAAQYVGRPSPVLAARLDHAAMLWRSGIAPLVVVTGGVGAGDTTSEAEVGRRYLLGRGIPDGAILLERRGKTTGQSIRGAAALLSTRHLRTVVLVSDPFHALRARVLAARHGLDATTSPTRTSPIARNAQREWRYVISESFKLPVAVLFPDA